MFRELSDYTKRFFDKTALRYLAVGLINTFIGAAISFTCFNLFNMTVMQSTACDYFFGSIVGFFLHKHFTFQKQGRDFKRAVRYAMSIAICWFIAFRIAEPAVGMVLSGFSSRFQGNISIIFGKGLYVLLNYFSQRVFVFKTI